MDEIPAATAVATMHASGGIPAAFNIMGFTKRI